MTKGIMNLIVTKMVESVWKAYLGEDIGKRRW